MHYFKHMRLLFLFSFIIDFHAMHAMHADAAQKIYPTATRVDSIKEDTIQNIIAHSYLSDAVIDFASLDRFSILTQLQTTIDLHEGELKNAVPSSSDLVKFDNHITLFNTLSLYDHKIKKVEATKNNRSLLSSLWYSLPFIKKPQASNEPSKSIKLPVEQQRILFRLLNKENDIEIPTTEKIKEFIKSRLNNDNNTEQVINYTWKNEASLMLPTTFCNGLAKFTYSDNDKPLDMSPQPGDTVLPATQFWRYKNGYTGMSDDTTRTNVNMPGHYSPYDASPSHFVGLDKDKGILTIFKLPRRERKYTIHTAKQNDVIEVSDIAVQATVKHTLEKPLFKKEVGTISALSVCQQTHEIIYGTSRGKDNLIYVQKIKNFAEPLSIALESKHTIDHIVQLDCFNFICLTQDGSLHRITKKFDRDTKKTLLKAQKLESNTLFSRIAIDHKTNLCAVVQLGNDYKDSLYTIDKSLLITSDRISDTDFKKIESKNPFNHELLEFEDYTLGEKDGKQCRVQDEQCPSTSHTIAPTLQCHNGTLIAWYPTITRVYGCMLDFVPLLNNFGNYSAIRVFKTDFINTGQG